MSLAALKPNGECSAKLRRRVVTRAVHRHRQEVADCVDARASVVAKKLKRRRKNGAKNGTVVLEARKEFRRAKRLSRKTSG